MTTTVLALPLFFFSLDDFVHEIVGSLGFYFGFVRGGGKSNSGQREDGNRRLNFAEAFNLDGKRDVGGTELLSQQSDEERVGLKPQPTSADGFRA